jgi:hypothetical protein
MSPIVFVIGLLLIAAVVIVGGLLAWRDAR